MTHHKRKGLARALRRRYFVGGGDPITIGSKISAAGARRVR